MIHSAVHKAEHKKLHQLHYKERIERSAWSKNQIRIGSPEVEPKVEESDSDQALPGMFGQPKEDF